jgi:hypothetical protein
MRRTIVALTLLVSSPWLSQPALAQERVIGLLALPGIFGSGACDRFTPRPVELRAAPQGRTVGAVVVVTPWTHHANGGCEGLTVGVQEAGTAQVQQLPTMEYAYEEPGAVVLERRANWYRVRTDSGSAWLEVPAPQGFYSLERLFEDHLTYLTRAWDGKVVASPGSAARVAKIPTPAPDQPVRVRRASRDRSGLWFLVDIMSSVCEGVEPTVLDQGWVPAYDKAAETTIWFHSRGC